MDDLKTIRNRCDILLAAANVSGDAILINKLNKVKEFLKNDNCFVGVDTKTARYNLLRLGYDFDQADEIYNYYNKVEVFSGLLEFSDNEGNLIQVEAMLSPSVEDYYIFDNGLIFKLNNKNNNFYYLSDGKWIYDAELQRKFYDSGYNYDRIFYKKKSSDSPRR